MSTCRTSNIERPTFNIERGAHRRVERSHPSPRPSLQRGEAGSRGRRGAAATEFAVVLPLVIVLCFTTVDFGRYVHAYLALTNAARVGAERGATRQFTDYTYDSWKSRVEQAVTEEMSNTLGADPESLTIEVETTEPDQYDLRRVTVEVTHPFQTVVRWPYIPSPLLLRSRVDMRQYR